MTRRRPNNDEMRPFDNSTTRTFIIGTIENNIHKNRLDLDITTRVETYSAGNDDEMTSWSPLLTHWNNEINDWDPNPLKRPTTQSLAETINHTTNPCTRKPERDNRSDRKRWHGLTEGSWMKKVITNKYK